MNLQDYKIWETPTPSNIEVTKREGLEKWKWLQSEKVTYTNNGEEKVWEQITRDTNNGVIAVLPVTPEWNIILIEEIRIPFVTDNCDGRTIGMPAWLVDTWDSKETTVSKELSEEVWLKSDDISYVDTIASSEWMTNEEVDIYIALSCSKVTKIVEGHKEVNGLILWHESGENIEAIYSVPYEKIDDFLDQARNEGMKKGWKIDNALRHLERRSK